MFEYTLLVELREPERFEQDASCNGCHEPVIYRMLEVGSRTPWGSGHGSQFRLCSACTKLLKEVIARG